MTYSASCKYRGTSGNLTIGGGNLIFTKSDGFIQKRERIVISIPTDSILSMNIEGLISKKLIVLVDGKKVPGIPRHEFDVSEPHVWMNEIQKEMSIYHHGSNNPPMPQRDVYVKEVVREIVKIPCKYCGSLNEMNEKKCSNCGATIG